MIDEGYYAQLKRDGKTWKQVTVIYNIDNGTEYTWEVLREKIRKSYERLTIQEEYKPKYEMENNTYIVHYGFKGSLSIRTTEEELKKALNLYCLAKMTLQATHLEMRWTRREFYAILKAFNIVKDSLPITPLQQDELNSDQIAEYVRINKLRYAHEKLNATKHNNIEKRVKQMDTVLFWQNELIEKVNIVKPCLFNIKKIKPTKNKTIIVYLTDVHAGLVVDNYFNTYNPKETEERLKLLACDIITKYKGCKVVIAELGDTIHGNIHGSVDKYSIWQCEQVTLIIELYMNFLLTLSKECDVTFSKVNGSHESIEKVKTDRTEEDSYGNIICDMLKLLLKNYPIKFIDKLKGLKFSIVDLYNYGIVLGHGDESSMKGYADCDRLFKDRNVIEVNLGHVHHLKNEDFNGLAVHYNEPLCGTDQYAGNKLMSSTNGTRVVEYTKLGRGLEYLVRY